MTPQPQQTETHVLLICSVGGTPEPIATAIRHWRPERILFICSDDTRPSIDGVLGAAAKDSGLSIRPGDTDPVLIGDPQDLERTLRDLRPLNRHVLSWQEHGGLYLVAVDFTGGTKVMSAALALVARRWRCTFAYVGGQRRTKGGVGVVETGAERVVHSANPWDALGYQAIEEAVTDFNQGRYAAAAHLLDGAVKNAEKPDVKRELATLKAVIDAYAGWDRFDHKSARQRFDAALKNRNDLAAIFAGVQPLVVRLEHHRDRVAQLAGQTEPTSAWVDDLLRNAQRRAAEHRFDDAVARLYRAIEALAQVALRERHAIPDTKTVPLDRLPQSLRNEWAGRARDNCVMLSLQDDYRLLKDLRDDLGRKFTEAGLDDRQSPLVARNSSILAHGFDPVGEKVYDAVRDKLLKLDSLDPQEMDWCLPSPPRWP